MKKSILDKFNRDISAWSSQSEEGDFHQNRFELYPIMRVFEELVVKDIVVDTLSTMQLLYIKLNYSYVDEPEVNYHLALDISFPRLRDQVGFSIRGYIKWNVTRSIDDRFIKRTMKLNWLKLIPTLKSARTEEIGGNGWTSIGEYNINKYALFQRLGIVSKLSQPND